MASLSTFGPRALRSCGGIAHAETTPSDRSDERAAHNSVYLEPGGTGLLWSANYDRMLGENFSLRAGVEMLSFYSFCDCNSVFFGIPIAASALILPGAHKLELGLGVTTFIGTTDSTGFTPAPVIWATGILGYRYAPKHSGFMLRATFTPLLARLATSEPEGLERHDLSFSLGAV